MQKLDLMKDLYLEYLSNFYNLKVNLIKIGKIFEQSSHPRGYLNGK